VDFFDGSINRIAAWVIGMRNTKKAILYSMLEPVEILRRYETEGDLGMRLALIEESKTLPFGAVWNMYCVKKGVPAGTDWMDVVKRYEQDVLSKREG
jgi:L-rhamnose isomerase